MEEFRSHYREEKYNAQLAAILELTLNDVYLTFTINQVLPVETSIDARSTTKSMQQKYQEDMT